MADGEGFARRVTLENLDEFREFLGTTTPASDDNADDTEREDGDDAENGKEPAGKLRSQKGRKTFPGEGYPVDLPYAPPTPPDRKEAGGTVTRTDYKSDIDESLQVLVATLPDSSTRWSQANFTLDIYEDYFGAKVGSKRTITLRHVRPDGTIEDIEQAESVESKSKNYRFELGAASGSPPDGRPIAVFLRLKNRLFLYRLLKPGDTGYGEAAGILSKHWAVPSDNVVKILKGDESPKRQVPRVLIDASELERMWPKCPLLKAAKP